MVINSNTDSITLVQELDECVTNDDSNIDYENRVIWLDTDVDDTWLKYERLIVQWNRDDKGVPVNERIPIKLMFFCHGGALEICWSFISIIEASETPVYGINMGQCLSAANFIYAACHKRFAMAHSTFLIHQGYGEGFSGTCSQLHAIVSDYKTTILSLYEYMGQKTNMPMDKIKNNFEAEWYISAEEALSYGMCDTIVSKLSEIF